VDIKISDPASFPDPLDAGGIKHIDFRLLVCNKLAHRR